MDKDKKKEEILNEIESEANNRKRCGDNDFKIVHTVFFIIVICSFLSSILILLDVNKYFVAFISGLSGLLILIDKSLSLSLRWKLNKEYFFECKIFKNKLDSGEDPYKIADEFYKYQSDIERKFPAPAATESSKKIF